MLLFSIITPLCQRETSARVTYKLASQEYLGCTRDQPMPGPFPVPPIFLTEKPHFLRGFCGRHLPY